MFSLSFNFSLPFFLLLCPSSVPFSALGTLAKVGTKACAAEEIYCIKHSFSCGSMVSFGRGLLKEK
jgi:hypothetical protein